ncbi:MAG: Acetoacetyl-CoA synthetase, partial [uncultured Thermoleophilia bacterium]
MTGDRAQGPPPVWTPPASTVEAATSTRLARAHGLSGHAELLERSLDDPEWFWDAVVRHLGLLFDRPYEAVCDLSDGPQWARWFVGGSLNLTRTCLDRQADGPHAGRLAVVAEREDGAVRRLSYAELRAEVARMADGLAGLGVGAGDRVALVMPLGVEAVVGFYAVAHLGAVVVPVFSGFSAAAIATRLVDSGAVAVLAADGFVRRGRPVPVKVTLDEALAAAPDVRHLVVHRELGLDVPWQEGRDRAWTDVRDAGSPDRRAASVPSEHPLMIAYTSGTTGRPKGAVHVHAGFLAKIALEVHVQADVHDGDALLWYTDMGWIMGPWVTVGTHANAGTLVLYDGAPDVPDPGRLWKLVERHRIAFLGVSPTLVRALQPAGAGWAAAADLSSLRAFGSTGEPWNPAPYRWLLDEVGGGSRPIVNLSGGTEVGACFLSADVSLPIPECSLGRPALGMAVDVVGPDGQPVRGDVGELVCRAPWPGMTRGLWGDPERYLASYWSRFPDVWVHGDWASVDEDGNWFLHGRSDDTLNVAGKRVGPAEYESALVG